MLTRFDKAIMAGLGAAASVITTAVHLRGTVTLSDGELAIGAFVVVGVLTFIWPNKAT